MRLAFSALLFAPALAFGQTRTDWQMHDGFEEAMGYTHGVVTPLSTCPVPSPRHGAICTYDDATVPAGDDGGWYGAPDPDTIGFHISSRLCGVAACRQGADFTYFQTFVDVPSDVVVSTFTIAFAGMDDGSRVTLYNSSHPSGLVIPGSYVYLGGSGTADLGDYVVSGEVNRVVVTQVDDCCSQNNLHQALVVLNGDVVPPDDNQPPVAECIDAQVAADELCLADASVDNGSYDPDGDSISIEQLPPGPYELGDTEVSLEVCDAEACDSCEATVSVYDDTPPTVSCNTLSSIEPSEAPISFTATAEDNCGAEVEIGDISCWAVNGAGMVKDKSGSCIVTASGDTLTIEDGGGVGTHIDWTATATDVEGNVTRIACSTEIAHPGNSGCNQGLGNGAEGCDPGDSNHTRPTNDESGGVPGNGGRRGGR